MDDQCLALCELLPRSSLHASMSNALIAPEMVVKGGSNNVKSNSSRRSAHLEMSSANTVCLLRNMARHHFAAQHPEQQLHETLHRLVAVRHHRASIGDGAPTKLRSQCGRECACRAVSIHGGGNNSPKAPTTSRTYLADDAS